MLPYVGVDILETGSPTILFGEPRKHVSVFGVFQEMNFDDLHVSVPSVSDVVIRRLPV